MAATIPVVRIYLAGPMASVSDGEARRWRELVTDRILAEVKHPVIIRCPVRHGMGETSDDSAKIAAWGITESQEADIVVADVSSPSPGTAVELHESLATHLVMIDGRGMPAWSDQSVFLRRFFNEEGNHLANSLDEAVQIVKKLIEGKPE